MKKTIGLFAAGALVLALSACGGAAPAGNTGGAKSLDQLVVGFAQVGAESGWRTANTKSIQDAATEARHRPEVLRRPAEAGEPDQGDPLLHPAEGGRHRVLPGRRDRLGRRPARRPRPPTSRSILTDRAVDSKDTSLYKTFLGSDFVAGGQEGRRVAGRRRQGRYRRRSTSSSSRAPPVRPRPSTARRASPTPSRPTRTSRSSPRQTGDFTRAGGKQVMEAFLKSHPEASTSSTPTTTTWASAPSRPSRQPARCPARTSRSSPSTPSRTACRPWPTARSTTSSSAPRCSGQQLIEIVKKLNAGETVPARIVTEEGTFTQEQAKAALPEPQVLSLGAVPFPPPRGGCVALAAHPPACG